MARIDDELAQALEASGPNATPAAHHLRASNRPKRNLGLLAALIAIAVGIGALVMLTLEDAVVYAKTVDQLMAARHQLVGRRVRVEGTLVHGSLVKRDSPCEFRFKLRANDAVVDVRYPQCVIPDTFQDRSEADVSVTTEGTLSKQGVFEADQILAKCPSKYEERGGKNVPAGNFASR
ncbi:MAG: cytochrome c maturation protein CcmE [Polyangiaceae bacterium]|jgi:cytochrome c-type biogenesis protein CcmE|nr:cytochrome c maturation protein CcmE [Polyangiaceae bacterium]